MNEDGMCNIGLEENNRREICNILNQVLSNQKVLAHKTLNAHWNVCGEDFYQMHLLTETQYKELNAAMDNTAERIRQLGGVPSGSLKQIIQNATLEEQDQPIFEAQDAAHILTQDHESCARELRENIDKVGEELEDKGTEDFLINLLLWHEKAAWMLRSTINRNMRGSMERMIKSESMGAKMNPAKAKAHANK